MNPNPGVVGISDVKESGSLKNQSDLFIVMNVFGEEGFQLFVVVWERVSGNGDL